jgi:hypothetical protein
MAMASAGAALLGLLFVAVSVTPQRTFGRAAYAEREGVASSAFTQRLEIPKQRTDQHSVF